ncbi:uncharacterized protein EAF01_010375 [Botrytis porri]|uniref:CCHC-type domain-containing protein n=1 Tax=Botrytis porri TaxID=87229 RepID=A0A4Z1KV85_9HELO|nr:uncharacterized protein EAF01_010375 [Botrytis porri]KAF7892295.1 hypothetical protein EAF01_010375 [Botrytis porri]TGO88427.1 hypothetical protein BPOR_0162g00010 [Botrytis porri]
MDSPAEDAVDSRSNVVGRKRALQTSSDQGREVVTIDSSSDESASQPRKRAKPSNESAKVEVDLTSSPLPKESIGTLTSEAKAGSPATWNQGVQSGLRTSFKSKKPPLSQSTSSKQLEQIPNDAIEKSQGRSEQKPMTKKQFNKLGEDKQLALMEANTQDVSALIDLHGWPVPEEFQQNCLKFVGEGLTFYSTPVKKEQPVGRYSFGGRDVQLRELYSEEGKPITSKDITYSDILLSLMQNNEFFGRALPDKRAKAAVKSYLSYFYNHIPQKEQFISSLVAEAPSPIEVLKNAKKGRPPTLARATDHYDKNASPAIINDGSVTDEALMKQNNASTSKSVAESNGDEESTRVAPTLVTNAIDPTRERTIPTEAGTVQMNHGSSNSLAGSEMEVLSDGGIATDVDDDHEFEAAREMGLRPEIPLEDHATILKYFPAIDGVIVRKCLICGSSGHDRSVCSDKACSSCGSKGDHLTPACPRTTICGKCREVGHQISQCSEKLRAVKDDVKCNTCQSTSHLEDQCHVIWRSFLPDPDEIKKVRNILAFCYFCGRPGHFGPECGLYRGKPASGGKSWSTSNMEKFLDGPNSYDDSLSLGGNDYAIPNRGKKGFTIKGKANDPIDLDDSDDDEGFIQPKVNMAPRNGHIQFSQAGAVQSFNQPPPFQFQGNTGGNQNSRGPSGNHGGRGGHRGGGGAKNKPKPKSGNNLPRGGSQSRGKAYRGRGGGGPARGAPRGRR